MCAWSGFEEIGGVPIWIADYVLAGYGTGAIMAVPGHDERDFAFALKYSLPITQVVHVDGETISISKFQMRGRFAMRLAGCPLYCKKFPPTKMDPPTRRTELTCPANPLPRLHPATGIPPAVSGSRAGAGDVLIAVNDPARYQDLPA